MKMKYWKKHGKNYPWNVGTLIFIFSTPQESCSFVFSERLIDRKPGELRHCDYDRMKSVAHKVG